MVAPDSTTNMPPNPYEVPSCQETDHPWERISCFFPLGWSRRGRYPVTCSDFISTDRRRQYAAAPNTYGDSLAVEMTSAEKRPYHPLRSRTISVPSYRPIQRSG